MTSEEMLQLIQRHRDQLVTEVPTALDGAAVAAFLLLTFAIDLDGGKITANTERLMTEWARNAVREAREIGFGLEEGAKL